MDHRIEAIAVANNLQVKNASKLVGGDINDVYVLSTTAGQYVLKLNDPNRFPAMFKAEAKGLELLRLSGSFQIPVVIAEGTNATTSYLLIEYIPSTAASGDFWERFATSLARLHRTTQSTFGLDHDNYIGSLRQYNCPETSASDFYINQRLIPQFRMAHDAGYRFDKLAPLYRTILALIPDEPPALIHGDLWNGNYLVASNYNPVLIDPAVAFAPREMDLAMMQLFGGFPNAVFDVYNEIYPLAKKWEQRLELYQLYYNLVHLNLFGSGYLGQVQDTIAHYR